MFEREGEGEEASNGVPGREGEGVEGVGENIERSRFIVDLGVAFPVDRVERDLGVLKLPNVLC